MDHIERPEHYEDMDRLHDPLPEVHSGDGATSIDALRELVRNFTAARKWEPYHNPKDLALSISIEAAELLEIMQWRPSRRDRLLEYPDFVPRVREELADVLIYCLIMANVMDLDVSEIVREKLAVNEKKYPVPRGTGT